MNAFDIGTKRPFSDGDSKIIVAAYIDPAIANVVNPRKNAKYGKATSANGLNAIHGVAVKIAIACFVIFIALQLANAPHQGVTGVDVDFKNRVPLPLPCKRWVRPALT